MFENPSNTSWRRPNRRVAARMFLQMEPKLLTASWLVERLIIKALQRALSGCTNRREYPQIL